MTPREIEGKRYWTPRILSVNTVLGAGGIVLWFFVSMWVTDIRKSNDDIKNDVKNLAIVLEERHGNAIVWRQEYKDRVDGIDTRLVKVERRVFRD